MTENSTQNEENPQGERIVFKAPKGYKKNKKTMLKKERGKDKAPVVVGALVLIFALVGVFSVFAFVYSNIQSSNKEKYNAECRRYETLIRPLAELDPPTFETKASIAPHIVLKSSIFLALKNNEGKLENDSTGKILLPCDEIEKAAKTLYGEDNKLSFISFDINENFFDYDEYNRSYHVPIVGEIAIYEPQVVTYVRKGNTVTLTVGYKTPDIDGFNAPPVKYMEYIVTGKNGNETIESVRTSSYKAATKKTNK